MKIGITPPEGFQLVPPSAPPASAVRPSQPVDPAIDVALTIGEQIDHAEEPLSAALAGPAELQTTDNLLTCIRAARARLRAIPR